MKTPKYMAKLRKWEIPSNYAGDTFFDYYCGPGQSRASEILEQSNFQTALEMLGGETETVIVCRAGHWAVGWVEQVLVHKSDKKALRILAEIIDKLDTYPVLDESDFSEREWEYMTEYADGAKEELAKAIRKHFKLGRNVSNKALTEIAYQLNIECQSYYGNDSCINIYDCRVPDKRDIEQFSKCLSECMHNLTPKQLKTAQIIASKLGGFKCE